MTTLRLDHVALNVKNIQTSIDWYVENLGCQVDYSDETWALLSIGGTKIALTLPEQHPPHVAFAADSLSLFPDGKIREHRDGSKYLYIVDPDGNTIEWLHWPPE